MKLTQTFNEYHGGRVYTFTFTEYEITDVILDTWDRLLIKECDNSPKVSDQLLKLEMLARRIEEQNNKDVK